MPRVNSNRNWPFLQDDLNSRTAWWKFKGIGDSQWTAAHHTLSCTGFVGVAGFTNQTNNLTISVTVWHGSSDASVVPEGLIRTVDELLPGKGNQQAFFQEVLALDGTSRRESIRGSARPLISHWVDCALILPINVLPHPLHTPFDYFRPFRMMKIYLVDVGLELVTGHAGELVLSEGVAGTTVLVVMLDFPHVEQPHSESICILRNCIVGDTKELFPIGVLGVAVEGCFQGERGLDGRVQDEEQQNESKVTSHQWIKGQFSILIYSLSKVNKQCLSGLFFLTPDQLLFFCNLNPPCTLSSTLSLFLQEEERVDNGGQG